MLLYCDCIVLARLVKPYFVGVFFLFTFAFIRTCHVIQTKFSIAGPRDGNCSVQREEFGVTKTGLGQVWYTGGHANSGREVHGACVCPGAQYNERL